MVNMNILTPERRQELVFRLAFTSAVLGLVIVLGVIGGELWVRWTMNQNFAFLGGFESKRSPCRHSRLSSVCCISIVRNNNKDSNLSYFPRP